NRQKAKSLQRHFSLQESISQRPFSQKSIRLYHFDKTLSMLCREAAKNPIVFPAKLCYDLLGICHERGACMAFLSFDHGAVVYGATPVENMFLLEYLPTAPDDCLRVYLYARLLCGHPEMGGSVSD